MIVAHLLALPHAPFTSLTPRPSRRASRLQGHCWQLALLHATFTSLTLRSDVLHDFQVTAGSSDADVFRQFLVPLLPEQRKRSSLLSNLEALRSEDTQFLRS